MICTSMAPYRVNFRWQVAGDGIEYMRHDFRPWDKIKADGEMDWGVWASVNDIHTLSDCDNGFGNQLLFGKWRFLRRN